MSFTLHFHWAPNDFFSNEILTKTYELKCEPQEDDPFAFEVCVIFSLTRFTSYELNLGSRNH